MFRGRTWGRMRCTHLPPLDTDNICSPESADAWSGAVICVKNPETRPTSPFYMPMCVCVCKILQQDAPQLVVESIFGFQSTFLPPVTPSPHSWNYPVRIMHAYIYLATHTGGGWLWVIVLEPQEGINILKLFREIVSALMRLCGVLMMLFCKLTPVNCRLNYFNIDDYTSIMLYSSTLNQELILLTNTHIWFYRKIGWWMSC